MLQAVEETEKRLEDRQHERDKVVESSKTHLSNLEDRIAQQVCAHVCVCMCVCVYIICMYICEYICPAGMHIHVCVCVCIHNMYVNM